MDANLETMNQDSTVKKSPFDDLSRDELIQKCKGLLSIAQKAKQAKTELQTENESYKLQLDKNETEKKSQLENVKTLQELVDSLTEQKLNYITEVDSARGLIQSLKTKCHDYEVEISKNKADLIVRDNTLADNFSKLSELDSKIISLQRQNNRLSEENEQLINQLTELESQILEFKNIGLEQREQLQKLEENVHTDEIPSTQLSTLTGEIKKLEDELQLCKQNNLTDIEILETKIHHLNDLCESERTKKEKANIKLKSYKDKILKCSACITQLKNSRFILTKTINEYSVNIPRWQNDILKASKILDDNLNQLNIENMILKEKLKCIEKQLYDFTGSESSLELTAHIKEILNDQICLKEKITKLEELNKTASDKIIQCVSEIKMLNNEYVETKSKLQSSQNEILMLSQENSELRQQMVNISIQCKNFDEEETKHVEKYALLNSELYDLKQRLELQHNENKELKKLLENVNSEKNDISSSVDSVDSLMLQIKALESEKAILVKEKLNAKENILDLEKSNNILSDQVDNLKLQIKALNETITTINQENDNINENINKLSSQKDGEDNTLKCELKSMQEQYDMLKKDHEDLQDLNGLLKEEVETLKLSLEQPRPDDAENLSDLNVSLQADIVKLETKLSAYKQENTTLLAEVKESRSKVKDYESLVADSEDIRTKLLGYKTENTELLNEMKEINQVLKERGEAISKLQKAITELERLVETLESERDNVVQEKNCLEEKATTLERELHILQKITSKEEAIDKTLNTEIFNKTLAEKEIVIVSLKEEIEKLKQQQTTDLPNEDMSTSTISKAEEHSRMRDLDESFEEKYTKLRIFALKLKKKLNDTMTQLQNTEQDKAKLEKKLNDQDKTQSVASIDETDSCKVIEMSDLQSKLKNLTKCTAESENIRLEMEKLKGELESKNQQLVAEIEGHKNTKDSLEKARRDAKKKNVLSLEMEDYERSMKELTTKMEDKRKKMVQMESIIDTQEGTITAMKTQIKLLEEQIKSEESQNRLTKEELQQAMDEIKEKEHIIQAKNETILKLEQDLEDSKRKNEEADLELTAMLSDKEKHIMTLGEEKIELNNKVKRLEFKCAELNETLRITNIELADLKTEYTSYKVRAQAVLRQNQTVDHSQEEQLKEEAAALRTQIETLTGKLSMSQEQCSEISAEVETLRRRHSEASNEASRAQQRTARLQNDLTRLSQQLESERSQHKLQVSTLTQCYKSQISEMEVKLQKETKLLRNQLAAAQENVSSSSRAVVLDNTNNQYMIPVIPKDDCSDGEMDINVSMIPREEGEGSESAPTPPPSKPYLASAGSNRSPVPLEKLLEEGVPEDEALDSASLALTPEQEIADLRRRLQAQLQRVKHVTVLLSESERECARMTQLSDLLKSELRRVHGTTQNAHNAEYTKNVTLKFLTLPPGDERVRLVPVLQKILTLTAVETGKLHAVAKGQDPNPKGWGSYLPWPGGK